MSPPARRKTTTSTTKTVPAPSGDLAPDHADPGSDPTPFPGVLPRDVPDRASRALMAKAPRYQRIAAELRARIETGQLAPGDTIPSETALLEEFGVSRITVRNAIKLLRAAGLVTTEQGRPTRVRAILGTASAPVLDFDATVSRADNQRTFITWDTQGWSPVEADSHYRATAAQHGPALNLPATEPVFILERHLQHTTGVEITHRVFVPFAVAAYLPELTANPFRTPAELYQILANAGHGLHWADGITAQMPTPDDAATLSIPDGVPLFLHTRITHGTENRPLILEETRLPADRIRITHTR